GGAEGAGPVEGGAERLVGPRAREAAVRRAAIDAEGARIEDFRPLEAEAVGQAVLGGGLVGEFEIRRLRLLLAHARELVVVLAKGGGHVRRGKEGEEIAGNGADAVGRNDVAGERLPPRPV